MESTFEYCVKSKRYYSCKRCKLVLGPDSGDPVDILCGLPKAIENGWDGPEERCN
jgi:rubredoxin